jgi:hypothetical protein
MLCRITVPLLPNPDSSERKHRRQAFDPAVTLIIEVCPTQFLKQLQVVRVKLILLQNFSNRELTDALLLSNGSGADVKVLKNCVQRPFLDIATCPWSFSSAMPV